MYYYLSLIPPLFHSECFLSNFKHKSELFNDFFSNQCSLINNNSQLPTNLNNFNDRHLPKVTFSAGDICKTIHNLNSSVWT